MKRQLLLISLLALVLTTKGQVDIINEDLTTSDAILYNYIDQVLSISGIKDTKGLSITSSCGPITKVNELKYVHRPECKHRIRIDTIRIFRNNKLIYTKLFKLYNHHYWAATLGNLNNTVLSVKQILSKPFVKIYMPMVLLKEVPQQIYSFSLFIKTKTKYYSWVDTVTESDTLTPEQLDVVKTLKSGDRITLEVKYGCKGSVTTCLYIQ